VSDLPPDARVPTDPTDGRRVIRARAAGQSLAERLAARLHRLSWRTPLHAARLRGRHPLKLLAVPDDPLPGDAAAGAALLDGRVRHRGEERALGEVDFTRPDWSPAFGRYLHGFSWLRDLSTVATRAGGAPVAEYLTGRWLAAHASVVGDPAWAPEHWGRRVLFWTAHAPLILSSDDIVYRSAVLNALARGARHLDRAADRAAAGSPRIAAWAGAAAAGLLLPGGDPRRALGEAGLARALGTGLFDDGGAVSRSPADLLDAVETLVLLAAAYEARGVEVPAAQTAALARMAGALAGSAHADGGTGSWQGAAPAPAPRVAAAVAAAAAVTGAEPVPLAWPRDWGYQRLASGQAVAILDAAPPPVGRGGIGGCASTLALELSDGPVRLVVNCGGAAGGDATLPAALAHALRTTAAHSTLTLADANSTAVLPGGEMGRGVAEVEVSRQEEEGVTRLDAAHDGYARRHGFRHRRRLMLLAGGTELRGEDQLLPAGRGAAPAPATPFAVRFHLGHGVEVMPGRPGTDPAEASVVLGAADGRVLWHFRARGAALSTDESVWIDAQGRPRPTQQIVLAGEAAAGGAAVNWAFRRLR